MTSGYDRAHRITMLGVALLGLLVAACGSSGPETFANCGNGILDAGEECDDGPGLPHTNDTDACLSTCKIARCGDGFVHMGVEDCDGNNLGGGTCMSLGFEAGNGLRCTTGCAYDVSQCGPPLPPTATPTASPTATVTATPLAGTCGNDIIEPGETCDDGNVNNDDDCPSDCRVQPCTETSTIVPTTVLMTIPAGTSPRSATVLMSYPDGVVGLPDGAERARIRGKSGFIVVSAKDFQHALRVSLTRVQGVQSGDVFSVNFHACAGAAPPSVSDFACEVLQCDNVEGCACSVELR